MPTFTKDPQAKKDYVVTWANRLAAGETLSTSTFDVATGITEDINLRAKDDTTATIWLSGGTAGRTYAIVNRVTTSGGRTDDFTFTIHVQNT